MRVRAIGDGDEVAVACLWRACGLAVPWNDPLSDIALCRSKPNARLLIGVEGDAVIASVMVGHDGHRGWFYYLAVAPDRQGRGLGRRMVEAAEDWLRDQGMPKVQLLIRDTNLGVASFYEGIGYARSPVIMMQKWLKPPSP